MAQIAGFRGVIDGVRDPGRAIYRYHQLFPGAGRTLTRSSLVCAVKVTPWDEGIVRPHELVRDADREAALAALRSSKLVTEPVVAGYRDPSGEINRQLSRTEGGRPLIEKTTPDGTIHRLWRSTDAEVLGKLRPLFAPRKLHVLEGHAQYEARLAQLADHPNVPMYSSANFTLAHLVDLADPALAVAPRHRILRNTKVTREDALKAVEPYFIIEKLAGSASDGPKLQQSLTDTVAHQPAFVAVFAGEPDAWKLTLKPDVSPVSEGVAINRALQKYDPVVIEHMFLQRALPGVESSSTTSSPEAITALGQGASAVLIVRPVSISQVAHVDELNGRLPAGSTAFYPTVLSLVGYQIEPDEDLV
jgi:uncharacterized protein (DUF1015 family)